MRPALLGLCALIALPLAAQDLGLPVTGPEFDAYVTGRTLTYAAAGQIYGTEAYLPGRRVIWAFTQAPIALVSALRETSIVFAVLIGVLVFKERLDRSKVIAVVVILLGAGLLRLAQM